MNRIRPEFIEKLDEATKKAWDVHEICASASRVYMQHMAAGTKMKLDCWDREEADAVSAYMKKNYPNIPFFTTFLEFKR